MNRESIPMRNDSISSDHILALDKVTWSHNFTVQYTDCEIALIMPPPLIGVGIKL